jgi:hypothetical protein
MAQLAAALELVSMATSPDRRRRTCHPLRVMPRISRNYREIPEPWPDARKRTRFAWRSRAVARSRPSWCGRPERRAEPDADRDRGQARLGRAEGAWPPGGAAAHGHPFPRRRPRKRRHGRRAQRPGRSLDLGRRRDRQDADKIGVGVEALQELRFAAKASGVEQQTLDMALQRFTRRAAEAAQGTGEAKDALAQMGIALRDQSGNLRRSEDPAERVPLAFKLFDSEGVALVAGP